MKQPKLTPDQWQQFNMLQTIITTYSPDPAVLRSSDGKGNCCYFPPDDKPLSPGCAIGCFIPWKQASKFKNNQYNSGGIYDVICRYPELLPKWMLAMNVDFLGYCQDLHDDDNYWDEKGLTRYGQKAVANICRDFELPYDLIQW